MANKTSKQTNKQQNKPFFSTFVFSLNSAFTSPEISSSSTSLQTKVKPVKRVTLWQAICQCTDIHILLMLWCTDKEKIPYIRLWWAKLGREKPAQIELTNSQITHRMRVSAYSVMQKRRLVPCTAWRTWFKHPCGWGYILGQVNQVQQNFHAFPRQGFSTRLKGCLSPQKFPALNFLMEHQDS